ncbi:GntR family transcriptional regulator [Komagataeibacter sp. FXV3]|nr:GntR family transcriptional regulator [Komagataeibacter sp. FXV3]
MPFVKPDGARGTLAQGTYETLKREIVDFRMPPGQRYSEHELTAVLQVSRTPLRLALHLLAHEGFVQHVGGHSCWQVRPVDLEYYRDLYDFRTDIEVIAIHRLCAQPSRPDLSTLRAVWDVPHAARQTDGLLVAEADEAFHHTLVRLAGNAEMLRSFTRLTDRIRVIRRLDFINPDRIAATYDEHAAIIRALDNPCATTAEGLIRAHIGASRTEIKKITYHQMAQAVATAGSASVVSQ